MRTLGTVSVLVGNVVDGVDDTVRSGVGVRALHHLCLAGRARVLQEAALIGPDAVASLVAVDVRAVRVRFVHLVQDNGARLGTTVHARIPQRDGQRTNLGRGSGNQCGNEQYDLWRNTPAVR